MRFNKLKSNAGITFIEVALTGIIIAATTVGLMYGFMNVTKNYQHDYLKMNLYRYGNIVMEELSTDFALAKEITVTPWMDGTDHIRLFVIDPGAPGRYITYSANKKLGILVNGEPLPRHRGPAGSNSNVEFEFPNYGQYFDGSGNPQITVEDFSVDKWVQRNQQLEPVAENVYLIKLRLGYEFETENGRKVMRYQDFQRRVFLTKAYINRKNTP